MDALEHAGSAFLRKDPYWPAQLAVLATILLDLDLPQTLTIRPGWLMPALEGVLLVVLVATTPWADTPPRPQRRIVAMVLISVVSVTNLLSLILLCQHLLAGGHADARQLVLAGGEIWITNVLIFGLWFWELDGGGPSERAQASETVCDFLYPQMTDPRLGAGVWRPNFVDYLYTSLTNAAAFSPTDTMPLTARAKLLMGVQSVTSLVTIGLVVARAVNILR